MSTPVCSVQITKGHSKLLKCHTFFFPMLDFSTVPGLQGNKNIISDHFGN